MSLIICLSVSVALYAETTLQTPEPTKIPNVITQLEAELSSINLEQQDRKTHLRFQRAEQYYQASLRYVEANWQARAIDNAQRGLVLIKLAKQYAKQPLNKI